MSKGIAFLKIDAGAWLLNEAIELTVYIGEASCEPCFEETINLKDLVDKSLHSYTIAGGEIPDYHHEDVRLLLDGLEKVYKYAMEQAKNIGVSK